MLPYLLSNATSPLHIFLIQVCTIVFGFMGTPAFPIFYKHFPVFKRFTYAAFTYALSRAFIYIITSFGLVYCADVFGNWAILMIIMPIAVAFISAVYHFEALEKETEHSLLEGHIVP